MSDCQTAGGNGIILIGFGFSGHWHMNDDAKHTLVGVSQDSGISERNSATPVLKTWVTPKVITSSLSEDTGTAGAFHNDGSGGGSPNS